MTRQRLEPVRAPRQSSSAYVWWCVSRAVVPALVVVIVAAGAGFLDSDFFAITEVVVCAEDLSLAEEVAAALNVPAGANTILFPAREIARQAKQRPRVLSARVTRDLPGRLIVRLAEREIIFVAATEDDGVVVDREGVFVRVAGDDDAGCPVVRRPESETLTPGGGLGTEGLKIVLECIDAAQEAGFGTAFELDLRTRYAYTLRTDAGVLVKLGGAENLRRKVLIAGAIQRHLDENQDRAAYIDVRVPGRPPTWKAA